MKNQILTSILPISENVSQAENFVVSKRMEIQEIRNVNVFHAELIWFAAIMSAACLVVINFNSLHFKSNVSMLNSSIEFRIAIDKVDSRNMMGNK